MAVFGSSFASSTPSPLPLNRTQKFRRTNSINVPTMSLAYGGGIPESLRLITKPPSYNMDGLRVKHAEKCKETRLMLQELEDPLESMIMVDALQRLCIDYHFEEEIDTVLHKHYKVFNSSVNANLHCNALHFRLLRQAGYYVPTDVFHKFTDKRGHFRGELSEDIRGLKSLYEASHLGMEGEDTLDEAKDFAHKHLNAKMRTLKPEMARAVGETLEHSYHKNLARFKVRDYLSSKCTPGWNSLIQELARMDFNIVQSLHQQELYQIFKWWTEMGLSKKLKFARDQPLKWYLWPMTVLSDPKHSEQRIHLTKTISLVYIIDDIFDVHGTLDELILFTEAVNKWEPGVIDGLPDYMKICFKALDNITNEISDKVLKEHGWNPVGTLQKAWATLCDAFLVEAKWFASRQVPKAKDYLRNGTISSGLPLLSVHAFFLLGQGLTKESVHRLEQTPALISRLATILRLWDDLGSAKDEKQEGHDGSYIECYKKEHGVSSIESLQDHVFDMISDSWKELNRECLSSSSFSPSFKRASLNFARMVPVMYSYNEDQCLPTLEKYVTSLLYENIPL
ncbi:(3S,6E)-nerolidol synthase 1-like [Macadamia integrifolia]|uniref:(3S,6E)-nerolidol synthase 1-like n=1 Tax=Macadamia integrifolia TaxID=60698 RepID=UPI001C531CC8|nr:(3S,6E)-nerolidol synthase 1-like [Macadamia integrifolia]